MLLTEDQVSKLLNRSLSTAETTNFTTYLKIATQRLEELLCMNVCADACERTYESRLGYRTVYVDPFTSINSVTIDGNATDDYTIKQFDKFNGSWYNLIEFDRKRDIDRIVVDAEWGFDKLPLDLQLLLAQLFNQGSVEQTNDSSVKSKKIEDFTVTYKDTPTYDEFVLTNNSIISKYSLCNQGTIRHGNVHEYIRPVYDY